jgi:NADH-quinone oxidoreductase subunit L
MAGEQDMRRMGGLKKYLPVTFVTMMIGTLAIAGIPPLAGFFSKDEILFRAFMGNKAIWALSVVTAFMTAFYMFRLMSMTFFGPYRGPAWEAAGPDGHGHAVATAPAADLTMAARHGAPHPADPHAHGQAHRPDHEVSHGPAHHGGHGDADAAGGGHGHGPWHGPHESPAPMTFPLMALAVGAIVAGFFGVPLALGGSNQIEQFLHPSFTASAAHGSGGEVAPGAGAAEHATPAAPAGQAAEAAEGDHAEAEHPSAAVELGLMVFSILIAVAGIALAWKFYVTNPDIPERLAARWSGAQRTLANKYYVDEFYDATVIGGTMASAGRLWTFDRRVVDGAVNGSGWVTLFGSWASGLTDRVVVDGAVNMVGWTAQEGSYWFRRLQTGLVQNYALLMLFGIFAFVGIYLIVR